MCDRFAFSQHRTSYEESQVQICKGVLNRPPWAPPWTLRSRRRPRRRRGGRRATARSSWTRRRGRSWPPAATPAGCTRSSARHVLRHLLRDTVRMYWNMRVQRTSRWRKKAATAPLLTSGSILDGRQGIAQDSANAGERCVHPMLTPCAPNLVKDHTPSSCRHAVMMVVDAMGERDRRLWPDWYQEVDQQYLQNGSGEAALSCTQCSLCIVPQATAESARCTASSNAAR